MSKKVKVVVSVLVAVVLLAVGGTATVLADENNNDEEATVTATENVTATKGLLARVADNLGITEEELVNAFKQARQEMREEAFIRYLDKAVEKGLITQEEADEIEEWWGERPEVLDQGVFRRAFNTPGLRGRLGTFPRGWGRLRMHKLAD